MMVHANTHMYSHLGWPPYSPLCPVKKVKKCTNCSSSNIKALIPSQKIFYTNHQSLVCRSPWNTWKFVNQVRQHGIYVYVCAFLYINQKNLIISVKIRISGRQPRQINANSAIPFKCPIYSESESIDKQSRGLTDRDRGWRG